MLSSDDESRSPPAAIPELDRVLRSVRIDRPPPSELDLSDLGLGDGSARRLARALVASNDARRVEGPTAVFLDGNRIGPDGASAIAEALGSGGDGGRESHVTCLNLGGNPLGEGGGRSIAGMLRRTTALGTLILYGCSLGADGAAAIANALERRRESNDDSKTDRGRGGGGVDGREGIGGDGDESDDPSSSLESLYIEMNEMGDAAMPSFSSALSSNLTLRVLDLTENEIGEEGAVVLAAGLASNGTLRELCLNRNDIGEAGAIALAGSIGATSALTTLRLMSCAIGDIGASAMSESLSSNETLRVVDLDLNVVGDDGAKALADALRRNATLEELGLSGNAALTPQGAAALAAALGDGCTVEEALRGCNHTLKRLDVVNDSVSPSSTECLAVSKLVFLNGAGSREARRRKVARSLDGSPEFLLSIGLDRKAMPRLLATVGNDCKLNTMFWIVRESAGLVR